jgi:hypothetical protein
MKGMQELVQGTNTYIHLCMHAYVHACIRVYNLQSLKEGIQVARGPLVDETRETLKGRKRMVRKEGEKGKVTQ